MTADLTVATFARIARQSLDNATANASLHAALGASVDTLPHVMRALVVGNGPSLASMLPAIAQSTDYLIAVGGALATLIQHGRRPDLVVTCDPHPRVAHWFGADADEHFQRTGEAVRIPSSLVGIPVAIATASHPRTVARCRDSGMPLFWWHAMLDDPRRPDSVTRKLWDQVPLPCLNGGGNVGTAAWVLAHAVLGAETVEVVGFDFGYPPDFPMERTQYAPELQALYGAHWRDAFIRYPNGWYADPTFAWYRQIFESMIDAAPCKTIMHGGCHGDRPPR